MDRPKQQNTESSVDLSIGELCFVDGTAYKLVSFEDGGITARLEDADTPNSFCIVHVSKLEIPEGEPRRKITPLEFSKPLETGFSKQGMTFEEAAKVSKYFNRRVKQVMINLPNPNKLN